MRSILDGEYKHLAALKANMANTNNFKYKQPIITEDIRIYASRVIILTFMATFVVVSESCGNS